MHRRLPGTYGVVLEPRTAPIMWLRSPPAIGRGDAHRTGLYGYGAQKSPGAEKFRRRYPESSIALHKSLTVPWFAQKQRRRNLT